VPLLQLDQIEWLYRRKTDEVTALCIVLWRLSWPSRWGSACELFHHEVGWLSAIWIRVIKYLTGRYRSKLAWDERLTVTQIQVFVSLLEDRGCAPGIWGFIDGTFIETARPGDGQVHDQQELYNGHHHAHGVVFQGVVTPDGLISSLAGPYEGRANDMQILLESGLPDRLENLLGHLPLEDRPHLFGDRGYMAGRFWGITASFKKDRNKELSLTEKRANLYMSTYRVSVEHGFGWVQSNFPYIGARKMIRTGLTPVGSMYLVACLLANCLTCLRMNQISLYYRVLPPLLEDYLELGGDEVDEEDV